MVGGEGGAGEGKRASQCIWAWEWGEAMWGDGDTRAELRGGRAARASVLGRYHRRVSFVCVCAQWDAARV